VAIIEKIAALHIWGLLVTSIIGLLMGINRTLTTRERESRMLQLVAAVLGLFLTAYAVFTLFQGGVAYDKINFTSSLMMLIGLSLCARQLERAHIVLVFFLVVALGMVWAIVHFGIFRSEAALLQKEIIRYIVIAAGVIVLAAVLLTIITIQTFVDLFLGILGLGPVVILLSCIGLAHAVIVLVTGNPLGVMRYFPWLL
jgi:hypothetical protein